MTNHDNQPTEITEPTTVIEQDQTTNAVAPDQATTVIEPDQTANAVEPEQVTTGIGPDRLTAPAINIGPDQPTEPMTTPLSTQPFTAAPTQPTRPFAPNPTASPYAQTAAPPNYAPPLKTGPRAGIIVWGLLVVLAGLLCLSVSVGRAIDLGLIVIGCLVVAGVALLIGSLIGVARSRNRHQALP